MPTITGNKIIFDERDWMAGFPIKKFGSGSFSYQSQKIGNYYEVGNKIDPWRVPGYLSPGFEASDVTDVGEIDNLLIQSVTTEDDTYAIENRSDSADSQVHNLNSTTGAVSTTAPYPHQISPGAGNTVTGQDMVLYKVGTTTYAFYSYKITSTTDGDIGRITFGSPDTLDDDFMSTVPANAALLDTNNDHPLIVGADDIMYIGDGNNVHAFDGQTGANGTLSKNALTIPTEYQITGFARIRPRTLVIFAHTAGQDSFHYARATAFFWDYLNNDFYDVVELNDNYVGSPFEHNGTIGCWTKGRRVLEGNIRKMQLWNGTRFKTVATVGTEIPTTGGILSLDNLLMFNSSGRVYYYGNVMDGYPIGLWTTMAGSGTSSGLLKQFTSSGTFASTGKTTSGGLQSIDENYAYGQLQTAYARPIFSKGQIGQVDRVKVIFAKSSSPGRNFDMKL